MPVRAGGVSQSPMDQRTRATLQKSSGSRAWVCRTTAMGGEYLVDSLLVDYCLYLFVHFLFVLVRACGGLP